jgi:hypothetical protein
MNCIIEAFMAACVSNPMLLKLVMRITLRGALQASLLACQTNHYYIERRRSIQPITSKVDVP